MGRARRCYGVGGHRGSRVSALIRREIKWQTRKSCKLSHAADGNTDFRNDFKELVTHDVAARALLDNGEFIRSAATQGKPRPLRDLEAMANTAPMMVMMVKNLELIGESDRLLRQSRMLLDVGRRQVAQSRWLIEESKQLIETISDRRIARADDA